MLMLENLLGQSKIRLNVGLLCLLNYDGIFWVCKTQRFGQQNNTNQSIRTVCVRLCTEP
jgi:hypothetical protein